MSFLCVLLFIFFFLITVSNIKNLVPLEDCLKKPSRNQVHYSGLLHLIIDAELTIAFEKGYSFMKCMIVCLYLKVGHDPH